MRSARTVIGRESQWPSFLFANKWPAPLAEAGHRCLCLVLLFLYYFVHCVHTVLLSKESARVIEIGVFRGYPKPACSQWTHASRLARYRPRSDSPEFQADLRQFPPACRGPRLRTELPASRPRGTTRSSPGGWAANGKYGPHPRPRAASWRRLKVDCGSTSAWRSGAG